MSQQIDNQIVKMEFDNASFEKNTKQTLSTLEKLKAALHFDKVNMTPLQQAFAETEATATKAGIHIRDIWLKMGNIIEDQVANKIVESGKKIANALSLEGINDGFKEYELKMGSIQTIMNGTGESLATVNHYLDELNTYSDKTIYSFSDMTNSIGKFTNNGVKLKDAVADIKGIANWAADAGAGANEMSHAMYNLSQALSSGYVKLIDWKSIENANMATTKIKDLTLEFAAALGTAKKETNGMYRILTENNQHKTMDDLVSSTKNFNDSLQYQWMTTDVLNEALKAYSTNVLELDKNERAIYEDHLKGLELSAEQIKSIEELGIRASKAATEVKTFSMLIDTLKEAIGSGWAMSWQYLIGDFEQAKVLWTSVNDVLGGVISKMDTARNNFLQVGLRTGWESLLSGGGLSTVIPEADKLRGIIIRLAKEQNILNQEQYDGIIDTQTLLDSLHEGKWMTGDLLKRSVRDYVNVINSMTKAERENAGFDDAAVAKLEEFNSKLQTSRTLADGFAASMNSLGGRENIIAGLANLFHSLENALIPIGESFDAVFGVMDPMKLYVLTNRFREFTSQLLVGEDAANTIRTSFTLFFTGVKVGLGTITTTVKGVTKLILPLFNLFDAIFGIFGKVLSALTGSNGAIAVAGKFDKVANKVSNVYLSLMQRVADTIDTVANAIRNIPESTIFTTIHNDVVAAMDALESFYESFAQMPIIQRMVNDFWESVDKVQTKINKLAAVVRTQLSATKTTLGKYINFKTLNDGLTKIYDTAQNFLKLVKGFGTRVKEFFEGLKEGKSIVESFRESFDDVITKIKELKESISGFFEELMSKGDDAENKFDFKKVADAIHEFVANITPDKITMIAVATAFSLITLNLLKLSDAMKNAVEAFQGVGNSLKTLIDSYVKKQKSQILQVAEAIAIVAASLWVLSTIPADDLRNAVGAMSMLTLSLVALTGALTIAGKVIDHTDGKKTFIELASGLAIIAGAFVVLTGALKLMEYINLKGVLPKILTVSAILVALSGLSILLGKFDKFSKGSLTILAVAGSLLLISTALMEIGSIDTGKLKDSVETMLKIMIGLAAVVAASKNVGIMSAVGFLSVVLMLERLMPTIEKIVTYDYSKINTGIEKNKEMLGNLGGMLVIMTAIGAAAGNRIKGIGIGLLALSGAFGILIGVAKLAGSMDAGQLRKGEKFLAKMTVLITLMELCSTKSRVGMFGGKGGGEGAKAFIHIATAMGILLGVAKLASMMEPKDLVKGELALAGLVVIVAGMNFVAKKCEASEGVLKNVAKMLTAVSVVLGMIGILSFIDWKQFVAPITGISIILAMLALLADSLSKNYKVFDKDFEKTTGFMSFLTMIALVVGTGIFIERLANHDWKNVAAAAGGIAVVLFAISGLAKKLASFHGNVSKDTWKGIAAIVVAALASAGVVTLFTLAIEKLGLDPDKVKEAATTISKVLGVMSVMALALALSGKLLGNNFNNSLELVGGAVAALVGVSASIVLLSNIGGDPDKMIASAQALTIGCVGIMMPIVAIGAVGRLCKDANVSVMKDVVIGAIVSLGAVAGAIVAVSNFGKDGNTILQSAVGLAIATAALAVPMAVIGIVGNFCKGLSFGTMVGLVGSAVLGLAGVALVLVEFSKHIDMNAVSIINAAMPGVISAIEGLGMLMFAIVAAGWLSGDGMVLAAGFGTMQVALLAFAELLTAVAVLGKVLDDNKVLRESMISGLDYVIIIADKIGEAIGTFIGAIGESFAKKLGTIADYLNIFSFKAKTFANNMAEIGENTAATTGCATIANAMLELSKVNFKEKKFKKLKDMDFELLGQIMKNFCESVSGVTDDAISKADICSSVVARLGGTDWKINKKDVQNFIDGIDGLGGAISSYCNSVVGIPETAVTDSQLAADAAGPVVALTKTLVGSEGFIQMIIGKKDLGAFGRSLTGYATGMKQLVQKLSEITQIDPNYAQTIAACADATGPLVNLAAGIENTGGILAGIVGDNTLDLFSNTLEPFADGLKGFIAKMSYIASHEPNYKQLIIDSADATNHLVTLANSLENMGGVAKAFTGDNTLDRFGATLEAFGPSLAAYVNSVKDIDLSKFRETNPYIKELINIGKLAKSVTADSFEGLKSGLTYLAEMPVSKIADEIMKGTPTVTDNLTKLFDALKTIVVLRTANDKKLYVVYGDTMGAGIIEGVGTKTEPTLAKVREFVNSILSIFEERMKLDVFRGYGFNVSEGVRLGIEDGTDGAVTAAQTLADKINATIPKVFQEHSPSRVAHGFGANYSIGLGNGISDYSGYAIKSTEDMATSIINTANDIISSISDVINSDMDTQPVIRPVLDTSMLARQARSVGSMFNSEDLAVVRRVSGGFNDAYNNRFERVQNEANNVPNQINFTQNNYSPKALSRAEIHRDTENQLSMVKGVIRKCSRK